MDGTTPEVPPGTEQPGVEYVVLNDDVLTSVYNASNVLVQGNDIERLAVLFQFPQFLEHCPQDTLHHMVPEICKNVVQWTDNSKMGAAEAFYFATGAVMPPFVSKHVAKAALEVVDNVGSGDIFDAWGEILSMALPQVSREDVDDLQLVQVTLSKSESPAVDSRRLAARLMGSLADVLTTEEVVALYLSRTVALCSDSDSSVRAMVAQSLANIGTKFPLEVSQSHFWSSLFEMVGDENARVKAAAVRAIARTAEAHRTDGITTDMYKTLLLPLFMDRCEDATNIAAMDLRAIDDDMYLMLEIFAEVYGYFIVSLTPLFADEDVWTVAINSLRRMVTCNGPTVRHWCAFNLPAVAESCGVKRPDRIKGVMRALATDTDVETRATLGAGMHELTRILARSELRTELLSSLGELLTDQNPQVRMNVLNHVAEIMEMLSEGGSKPVAKQMSKVFTNLEVIAQDSWRAQKLLAEQLDRATHLIPQDILSDQVAPVLFQMARESTYQVRRSAIATVIRVLRFISATAKRDRIINHFTKEWAQGKVYWTRLAYLDGTNTARGIFSRQLFLQLFVEEALKMSKDSVPNVRLSLVRLMENTIGLCGSLPLYQDALKQLTADKDPQVRQAALQCKRAGELFPGFTEEENEEDRRRMEAEKNFVEEPKAANGSTGNKTIPLERAKPPPTKSFSNMPPPLKPPMSPNVVPSKFLAVEEPGQEERLAPPPTTETHKATMPNGVAASQPDSKPPMRKEAPKPAPARGGCCVVQ